MALLAGPKWPKPDAIVLISTCFQQQKAQGFSLSIFSMSLHLDSNIKSLRKMPNDMRFIYILYFVCLYVNQENNK